MKQPVVQKALEDLRDKREQWQRKRQDFLSGYDFVMSRLILEACANYMSAEKIAEALGVSKKVIRSRMRTLGLDPRKGTTTLSQSASSAMLENAAIMGIDPSEMDLLSPLAYLPMGQQMKDEFHRSRVSQVTEIETTPISEENAQFFARHYEGWVVHSIATRIHVPLPRDRTREDAVELIKEALDEAEFGIRMEDR